MIVRPLQIIKPKPVGTIRPFTMRKHSGAHRGGECRWHTGHVQSPIPGNYEGTVSSFRFFMEQSEFSATSAENRYLRFLSPPGPALRAVRASSQGARKPLAEAVLGLRLSQERAYVARLSPDSSHKKRRHHRLIRSPRRRGRAAWKGVRVRASSRFLNSLSAETEPDVRQANLPAWHPAAPCAP